MERVIAAEPRNPDAYDYLGYGQRKLAKFDVALNDYVRALAIDPSHRGANEYVGELHLELGQVDRAEGVPSLKKKRGQVVFSIEPVDWPESAMRHFAGATALVQGAKAIVRYDQGAATYFHASFGSDSFAAVVDHFRTRFGRPTESWDRRLAAPPGQANPMALWRSVEPSSGLVATLEVRKHDDSRGGLPDLKHGAVLLHHARSASIFPELSNIDLMMLK